MFFEADLNLSTLKNIPHRPSEGEEGEGVAVNRKYCSTNLCFERGKISSGDRHLSQPLCLWSGSISGEVCGVECLYSIRKDFKRHYILSTDKAKSRLTRHNSLRVTF